MYIPVRRIYINTYRKILTEALFRIATATLSLKIHTKYPVKAAV